jgi:hypothetical protein
LEDLKISSSFCAFVPSAYYVHWSDFGWFWMQMWCTLENQCVYTPIKYTKFQVPMHLQFCVSNITWKNTVTLLFCSSTIDRLEQGSIWTMWRPLALNFNLSSYI